MMTKEEYEQIKKNYIEEVINKRHTKEEALKFVERNESFYHTPLYVSEEYVYSKAEDLEVDEGIENE